MKHQAPSTKHQAPSTKQRAVNFRQLLTNSLIILICTLAVNCQKEDFLDADQKTEIQHKKPPSFSAIILDGDSIIKSDPNLKNRFYHFNKAKISQRTMNASDNTFSIDTTRVQKIQTSSYVSYTFNVKRSHPVNDILENFVIFYFNDDTYKQYFISYPLMHINGETTYSISNAEISTIDDENLMYNKDSSCLSLMEYTEAVCVEIPCKSGDHTLINGSQCDYWQTPDRATIECTEAGWVDPGCSSGGGADSSEGTGTSSGGGGAAGSTENNNDDEAEDEVIVPLDLTYTEQIENCINGSRLVNENDTTTIAPGFIASLNLVKSELKALNDYLILTGCSVASQKLAIEFLKISEKLPGARFIRFMELDSLLQENPWALIQDCAEQNGLEIANYQYLYNHTIPQECQDRLNILGEDFENQPINEGNAAIANVDYYGIEITQNPDFDNDGYPDNNEDVYGAFKVNFMELASGEKSDFELGCSLPFIDSYTVDISWEFLPYFANDINLWNSNNPLTAIFKIYGSADVPIIGDQISDDGAIIISDFTINHWIGSTIKTGSTGSQPFSGNRQWGWLSNQHGNLELFTRAVDVAYIPDYIRANPFANDECDEDTYYNIADATWENLQNKLLEWIIENGGQATIKPKTVVKIDKEKLKEALESNDSIDEILCN